MDKKRKILNNQQLTDVVVDHELRITKLETKKKKIIKKGGKGPKVTIADVMQALVQFKNSVDQRFDKLETRMDKIEIQVINLNNRVEKLENRIDKLENSVDQRFDKIENRIDKLEISVDQQFNDFNNRVIKIEKAVFKKQIKN